MTNLFHKLAGIGTELSGESVKTVCYETRRNTEDVASVVNHSSKHGGRPRTRYCLERSADVSETTCCYSSEFKWSCPAADKGGEELPSPSAEGKKNVKLPTCTEFSS